MIGFLIIVENVVVDVVVIEGKIEDEIEGEIKDVIVDVIEGVIENRANIKTINDLFSLKALILDKLIVHVSFFFINFNVILLCSFCNF